MVPSSNRGQGHASSLRLGARQGRAVLPISDWALHKEGSFLLGLEASREWGCTSPLRLQYAEFEE